MERLGLIALAPLASALVQGSVHWYENGACGEGVADAQQFWLKLRQQMSYKPQLQALPWAFVQSERRAQE